MTGQAAAGLGRHHRTAAEGHDAVVLGQRGATAGTSSARKCGSPSSMKISAIGLPARRSMSASVSRSATPQRSARICADRRLAGAHRADQDDPGPGPRPLAHRYLSVAR